MRYGDPKKRLVADSFQEVTRGLMEAFMTISSSVDTGPTGRKFTAGHLLNAIVYAFVRLPPAEQIERGTLWLAELETILAETDDEKREASKRLASLKKPDGLLGTADLTKLPTPAAAPKKRRPKKM